MIAATLAGLGCLVVLLVLAFRREHEAEQDWSLILSPEAGEAYEALRARLTGEERALSFTYDRAAALRGRGDPQEALRMLGVGYDYLADLIPDRMRLLRGLSVYTRMVSGLAPAPANQLRLLALRRSCRAVGRSFSSAARGRASWDQVTAARADLDAFGQELDRLVRAIAAAVPHGGHRA